MIRGGFKRRGFRKPLTKPWFMLPPFELTREEWEPARYKITIKKECDGDT